MVFWPIFCPISELFGMALCAGPKNSAKPPKRRPPTGLLISIELHPSLYRDYEKDGCGPREVNWAEGKWKKMQKKREKIPGKKQDETQFARRQETRDQFAAPSS